MCPVGVRQLNEFRWRVTKATGSARVTGKGKLGHSFLFDKATNKLELYSSAGASFWRPVGSGAQSYEKTPLYSYAKKDSYLQEVQYINRVE